MEAHDELQNDATQIKQLGERVFCSRCNKSFKRKATLKDHILTNHLGFKVPCPVCGKKYTSISVVNRHLRVVHNISSHRKINPEKVSSSVSEPPGCFQAVQNAPSSFEQLGFKPSKSFPVMSDVLKVEENKTFGKHLVAACDIDIGKTLMISSAYASVEYVSSRDSLCFHCGKQSKQIQCQYCID